MLVKTVEPTVPALRVPEVWPAWAPLADPSAPQDWVNFVDARDPQGQVNCTLLFGLLDNFGAAKIAQAPLPEPDSTDLEIDAQELVESENPGAYGKTIAGVDDSLAAAESLQRDAATDLDLRDLQPQVSEVVYQATSLRKSLKRTSTAAGESKILSASVTRSHTSTRVNPTHGRLRVVSQGLAVRRSQSANAISTRRLAQTARVVEKTEEAASASTKATEQATSLGGLLRYLGAFARASRKSWSIGPSRLSDLGQRVPGETQDLLNKLRV